MRRQTRSGCIQRNPSPANGRTSLKCCSQRTASGNLAERSTSGTPTAQRNIRMPLGARPDLTSTCDANSATSPLARTSRVAVEAATSSSIVAGTCLWRIAPPGTSTAFASAILCSAEPCWTSWGWSRVRPGTTSVASSATSRSSAFTRCLPVFGQRTRSWPSYYRGPKNAPSEPSTLAYAIREPSRQLSLDGFRTSMKSSLPTRFSIRYALSRSSVQHSLRLSTRHRR